MNAEELLVGLILLVLNVVGGVYVWWKIGRDYDRERDTDEFVRRHYRL